MKKIISVILTVIVFITVSGFRGCNYFEIVHHVMVAGGYATGKYREALDNTQTSYGIIVGEEGKINTSEGRPPLTWVPRISGTMRTLNYVKVYNSPDSSIAFAVGNFGTVLRSSDKGHTWDNRSLPSYATEDLFGFDFVQYQNNNNVHIVAVGDSGKVFRSNNYGTNWVWYEYFPNTIRKLKSVVVINFDIYVVVGERGTITRTTNQGETWQNISAGDTNTLNRIVQVRYDTYLIAGNNGKIFRSTNYGSSWQSVASGTTKHLRDIIFKNENEGAVVGDDGTVRNTTNGGLTWTADSYLNGLTTRDIIAVAEIDSVTVNSISRNLGSFDEPADSSFFLAVSSDQFIGIEPVSNLIADVFSLMQNYPNPFNPVTNIEITLPKASYTKLAIYDVQGREIEILVDKHLQAGSYKVDWQASGYPSGVYFYVLNAGDFTETKKMVLIK